MRRVLFLFLTLLTAGLPLATAMSQATPPQSREALALPSLGVRTLRLEDPSRKRPVLVEVWYPTDASAPIDSPQGSIWVHPEERRDAPLPSPQTKRPLILISHGHGGERRESTWLAEALVKQGFLVAAIEHHGSSLRTFDPLTTVRFWERSKDVSFVLDQLLQTDWVQARVDPKRIGLVGYSLGGMTGLHVGGARARGLKQFCLAHRAELESHVGPVALEDIDFSEGEAAYRDPRIRALLLVFPATFVFSTEALQNIQIPVGLIASTDDEVLNHLHHSFRLIQSKVPAKLKILRDRKVSHYAYLNRVAEKAKAHVPAPVANDPPSYRRSEIHAEMAEFAREFFSENLN